MNSRMLNLLLTRALLAHADVYGEDTDITTLTVSPHMHRRATIAVRITSPGNNITMYEQDAEDMAEDTEFQIALCGF